MSELECGILHEPCKNVIDSLRDYRDCGHCSVWLGVIRHNDNPLKIYKR